VAKASSLSARYTLVVENVGAGIIGSMDSSLREVGMGSKITGAGDKQPPSMGVVVSRLKSMALSADDEGSSVTTAVEVSDTVAGQPLGGSSISPGSDVDNVGSMWPASCLLVVDTGMSFGVKASSKALLSTATRLRLTSSSLCL